VSILVAHSLAYSLLRALPQPSAPMFLSALPTLLHCLWLREYLGPDTTPDYYPDADIDGRSSPLAAREKPRDGLMPTVGAKQDSIYQAWLTSRHVGDGQTLAPGEQRRVTPTNILIALRILSVCVLDLLELLWGVHPMRTIALVLHNLVRGVLPAVRLHSQAGIIDAVSKRPVKFECD
jgi:hypothetical protein